MAAVAPSVTEVNVDGYTFPPTVTLPGSNKTLFLGGAGARGLHIEGKFVKFTAISVYLEGNAVQSLAVKWKGKTAEELMNSIEFFRDVVTGPFDKFIHSRMISPLSGPIYAEKVTGNCIDYMKSVGTYTDAEAKAIEKFREVFKDKVCPLGSSILYTQSTLGIFTINFSKDGSLPKEGNAVIENKPLSETVLETMIGKDGVCPAAKQSLAARISELLNKCHV